MDLRGVRLTMQLAGALELGPMRPLKGKRRNASVADIGLSLRSFSVLFPFVFQRVRFRKLPLPERGQSAL